MMTPISGGPPANNGTERYHRYRWLTLECNEETYISLQLKNERSHHDADATVLNGRITFIDSSYY